MIESDKVSEQVCLSLGRTCLRPRCPVLVTGTAPPIHKMGCRLHLLMHVAVPDPTPGRADVAYELR